MTAVQPTTEPASSSKEKPAVPNTITFTMPGKVYDVLTGALQLKDFTPKPTKTILALLDRAERSERSKGFVAKITVTPKQGDALIDLLTDSISKLSKVTGRTHHETNTSRYMAQTIDRITQAQDLALDEV